MKLRCTKCGYEWNYRGQSKHYATCPDCQRKIKIKEARLDKKRGQKMKSKGTQGTAKMVGTIIEDFENSEEMLIQILLKVQESFGWIPREVLRELSNQLGIRLPRIYKIVTFYKIFNLEPEGEHTVRMCVGTSCKARGSSLVLNRIKRHLEIEPGETTPDREFSLETVNCLGCCAIGPVMEIDGKYYGDLDPSKAVDILEQKGEEK